MVNKGYDTKQFFASYTILPFRLAECPASISYYTFFIIIIQLREHCPYPSTTCISVQYKGFIKIRKCQNWCCGQALFQMIKSCLAMTGPFKLGILFSEAVQRLSNYCKIFNKSAIVTYKTKELSNFSLRCLLTLSVLDESVVIPPGEITCPK